MTDGESFCHEQRRDLDHQIEYPEAGALLYRLTNSDHAGRYRVIKEFCTDPHSSALLINTRIEIVDESLRPKLRAFALLAPHFKRGGMHNSAALSRVGGRNLVLGCEPDFTRRSVGYVGASDGWQDLQDFAMDWESSKALDGNVALTAELDLTRGLGFVLGVAMGRGKQSAATKLLQSLGMPFREQQRRR